MISSQRIVLKDSRAAALQSYNDKSRQKGHCYPQSEESEDLYMSASMRTLRACWRHQDALGKAADCTTWAKTADTGQQAVALDEAHAHPSQKVMVEPALTRIGRTRAHADASPASLYPQHRQDSRPRPPRRTLVHAHTSSLGELGPQEEHSAANKVNASDRPHNGGLLCLRHRSP